MGKFDGILLASDLDGTLLNRAHQVSEKNREAIKRFIALGGRFTVATGRALQAFEELRFLIPINAPVILANGAMIYDCGQRAVLYERRLRGDYMAVCEAVRGSFPEVAVEAHRPDGIWVVGENEASKAHQEIVKVAGKQAEACRGVPEGWLKALFVGDPAALRALHDWFIPRYGSEYDIVFSHPCLLEMQDKQANKGTALLWLARMLSVPTDRVYCAGDNQNDLPMLRAVVSFAPAGAESEALAAADHIMPDCDVHMIAAVIKWLDAQGLPPTRGKSLGQLDKNSHKRS